ncbi:CBM21 (carbohydrate binding type-21) domain [Trinorchestia longiramus]|nr:CBM21 (carbohydrate binding type-21) domain [Trinorchestia longiramus]
MDSQNERLDAPCSSEGSRSSVSSMIWPLPCSLTSLLKMNCRARAEGLARSVQAKMRHSTSKDDTVPLHSRPEGRSVSVDASDDEHILMCKPLHVVTSEPTIHTDYSPPDKLAEEDSDLHYDFGLVTPEDCHGLSVELGESSESLSKKISVREKNGKKWAENKGESNEKPESGCVTSVTSPVMFRDDMLSSTPPSPSEGVLSPANSTDLKAVREILSFTSFVEGIQGMTFSLSELSAVDSRLYSELSGVDSELFTDVDLTHDSPEFFSRAAQRDNEEEALQTTSEAKGIVEYSVDSTDDVEKYGKVTPPEGFRNSYAKELSKAMLGSIPSDQRRRSFDLPLKSYQQQTTRWSSPPGYRSGFTLPGGLCLTFLRTDSSEAKSLPFKHIEKELIKKHESQVVCSAVGVGCIKTELCRSSDVDTLRSDRDKRKISSTSVTSFLMDESRDQAWPAHWENTETDDSLPSSFMNATLGTTTHSWHKASDASLNSSAAAVAATAAAQPQLITATAVCGQPAPCDELCLSRSDNSRQASELQALPSNWNCASVPGVTQSENNYTVTMRDECEPALPSFSRRRRRYKVTEGQSKSNEASCSNIDPVNAKVNDLTSLNSSEASSEPGSPGSMRDCDSSEPTSPMTAETNISNSWPVTETKESPSTSSALASIQSIDKRDEVQGEDESKPDDDEPEEDIPAIVEGKFKHMLHYKEKVRKLSDADEDAYDPSITTVIQLDENELTEEEEDVSLNEEVNQQELDAQLNRLQIEGPEMRIQNPSDESSRDSSSDPVEEDIRLRIKRSSSLKCGKTPPGTPGTKKIVRFADSLGLDLAECRTFLEGIPNVPKSAFGDLQMVKPEDEAENNSPFSSQIIHSSTAAANRYGTIAQKRMLMPLFQQPCILPGFLDRVRASKVSLETISVGEDMSVRGYVRVLNIDFHKHVVVRYTFDGWRNFHEATATYVHNSCDGFSDKFSFLLWGSFLQENGSLTFCIRYSAGGSEYWDNNRGTNYVLQCYTSQIRPQLHQQALHQHADNSHSSLGGGYSRHLGSTFQNSPPTPSDNWTGTFF